MRKGFGRALTAGLAFCALACGPSPAGAKVYQFTDEGGTFHMTNVVTVPGPRKNPLPVKTTLGGFVPGPARGPSGPHIAGPYMRPVPLRPASVSDRVFDPHIKAACVRYGVDHHLVRAMLRAESGGNTRAVSPKGAQGLMQLMPGTSRLLGVQDPFDPRENIEGGVLYFRGLLDRFGSVEYALAAYNAGPENVERYRGMPPFDETRAYVKRVMTLYARYRQGTR